MKRTVKGFTCLFFVCLLLYTMCMNVSGADCLTLSCTEDTEPIQGMQFSVYLVAYISADGKTVTPTESFASCPVVFDVRTADEKSKLAQTLSGYVLNEKTETYLSGISDAYGNVYLNGLTDGLYLVTGKSLDDGENIYVPSPFLITYSEKNKISGAAKSGDTALVKIGKYNSDSTQSYYGSVVVIWKDSHSHIHPDSVNFNLFLEEAEKNGFVINDDDNWYYQWGPFKDSSQWNLWTEILPGYTVTVENEGNNFVVTFTPKDETECTTVLSDDTQGTSDVTETTDVSRKDNEKGKKLPQTGLLWWPVPLTAAAGTVLIAGGLVIKRREHPDEK